MRKLAVLCGMTPAGLHQAMSNETLKIETLEKIADALDVPVTNFFQNKEVTVQPDQINEKYTPRALAQGQTANIMTLDITDKERVKMLSERVSVLELQLTLTEQILKVTKQELKRFKP